MSLANVHPNIPISVDGYFGNQDDGYVDPTNTSKVLVWTTPIDRAGEAWNNINFSATITDTPDKQVRFTSSDTDKAIQLPSGFQPGVATIYIRPTNDENARTAYGNIPYTLSSDGKSFSIDNNQLSALKLNTDKTVDDYLNSLNKNTIEGVTYEAFLVYTAVYPATSSANSFTSSATVSREIDSAQQSSTAEGIIGATNKASGSVTFGQKGVEKNINLAVIWDDENNRDQKRPTTVSFEITDENGTKTIERGFNSDGTLKDATITVKGETKITEKDIDGYTITAPATVDASNTLTFTNKHVPVTAPVDPTNGDNNTPADKPVNPAINNASGKETNKPTAPDTTVPSTSTPTNGNVTPNLPVVEPASGTPTQKPVTSDKPAKHDQPLINSASGHQLAKPVAKSKNELPKTDMKANIFPSVGIILLFSTLVSAFFVTRKRSK